MRAWAALVLAGCGSTAEYTCDYDDPALGDYGGGEMSCADYRDHGDQILEDIRSGCDLEASEEGTPPTCTCAWTRTCPGDAND